MAAKNNGSGQVVGCAMGLLQDQSQGLEEMNVRDTLHFFCASRGGARESSDA